MRILRRLRLEQWILLRLKKVQAFVYYRKENERVGVSEDGDIA